jgi:hypothetical protein
MVPKVAGKGSSFKGAALYYLHDKGAMTSERVAFCHTENLPTRDAEKAIKCMAWTAIHQSEIKARAGGSAKGRKLTMPVYTYSLSWAPDESPSPQDMIAAARESVRVLGLEGHETLFVAHNDEPHPHIHVIVNRVHPETGIAAPLSKDHLKLSAWAEAYEKAQGRIRCEQRVENNERRRKKQWVKDQFSQRAGDFHRWQRLRAQEAYKRQEKDKDDLSATHKAQRQALFAAKEQQIKKADAAIRERHRDRWRVIYQDQDEKRQRLRDAQKSIFAKVKYFLKEARSYLHAPKEQRSGFLRGIFTSVVGGPKQFEEMDKKQRELRSKVSGRIDEQRKAEFRKINVAYKDELARLKDKQQAEKDAMEKRQAKESRQRAKAIKEQADHQARRQQGFAKTLRGFRQAGHEITAPQSKLARDFENGKDSPAHEDMRSRLRRKMTEQREKEIRENALGITQPQPNPTRDFNQARGSEPKHVVDKNKTRRKDTYRAFRELADEVTQNRNKGGGRSFTKKPAKGPEFR